MEPMFIISPDGVGRDLKMGRMACVMLIRPVTFVLNIVSISAAEISGAWATPFTRPLFRGGAIVSLWT